jgi:alpha-galactosidase
MARQQADYLVSSGMAAAGYRTMIIQECITLAGHRDARGVPQPDPEKFPHGIKSLCDYLHSKDLLCGSKPGLLTQGVPGCHRPPPVAPPSGPRVLSPDSI